MNKEHESREYVIICTQMIEREGIILYLYYDTKIFTVKQTKIQCWKNNVLLISNNSEIIPQDMHSACVLGFVLNYIFITNIYLFYIYISRRYAVVLSFFRNDILYTVQPKYW